MPKKPIHTLYNPGSLSKEELIKSFVVRLKKFDRLFTDIKSCTMEHPEQPYMIEAQRGMGKTTLILRLAYEIENDPTLSSWLLPVVFNEEEYSIRGLYSIWELVAEILAIKKPDLFEGLLDAMDELHDDSTDDQAYEMQIFKLLEERLLNHEKKIIVFIENFDDVIGRLSNKGIARLRTILQTSSSLRLIIAAPVSLESFFEYDKSFYNFFKHVRLDGLNQAETIELLKNLGRLYGEETAVSRIIEEHPGRVEGLRRLTGGIIRTIVILFEIFLDDQNGDAFKDLQKVVDSVTAFYKDRMDDLPKNQQVIVNAIGRHWDAIEVKEIAVKTRLESKVVSAQLNQLYKNGVIRKIPTTTKNNFYQLKERFFNIWYLMRFSRRGDQQRVLWLTRFYEAWCDPIELEHRAKKLITSMQLDGVEAEYIALKAQAMSASNQISKTIEHDLIRSTKDFLEKTDKSLLRFISDSDIELLEKFKESIEAKDYRNSLKLLQRTKRKDGEYYLYLGLCYDELDNDKEAENSFLKAIELDENKAYRNLGLLYKKINQLEKAENFLLKAVAFSDELAYMNLGDLYADHIKDYGKAEKWLLKAGTHNYKKNNNYHKGESLNSLAILYEHQADYKNAIKYYEQSIELGNDYALKNLGELYFDYVKDYEKAEEWLLKASAHEYRKENNYHKGESLNRLAVLYKKQGEYEKAAEYYKQAIEFDEEFALKNLGDLYAEDIKDYAKAEKWLLRSSLHTYRKENEKRKEESLNSLAIFYKNQRKYEKAMKYFEQSIELGNEYAFRYLGELYADDIKDYDKAEEWLLKASTHTYIKENEERKSEGLNSLAIFYKNQKKYEKAMKCFEQSIKLGNEYALKNLGDFYAVHLEDYEKAEEWLLKASTHTYRKENQHKKGESLNSLAVVYENQKEYEKAIKYFEQAIELGNEYALKNLGDLYAIHLEDYEKAEEWLFKASTHNYETENEYRRGESLNSLAIVYKNQKDYEKAIKYFEQAIELGNEYALKNIGDLYLVHIIDYGKAEEWLLKASTHTYEKENEHRKGESLNSLAVTYKYKKDYEKAMKYFEQSIELGNEYALKNIGDLYTNDIKDYAKAEKWLLKASTYTYSKENQHKKRESLNSLAITYKYKKEYEKAIKCFEQAIELGNEQALKNLGDLYANDIKDYVKAEKWLKKAIEYNYKSFNNRKYESANSLSWLFYSIARNKKAALKYGKIAYEGFTNSYISHTLASVLLWNNENKESWILAQEFLFDTVFLEKEYLIKDIQNYLVHLLSKKQYGFLEEYFLGEKGKVINTKDRFKPIYYALMIQLKDKYPNEYLRMGPELKETVEEVLVRAEEMTVKYA